MGGNAARRAGVEAGIARRRNAVQRGAQLARLRQPRDQVAPAERAQAFAVRLLPERERLDDPGRFSLEHADLLAEQGSRSGKAQIYLMLGCRNWPERPAGVRRAR